MARPISTTMPSSAHTPQQPRSAAASSSTRSALASSTHPASSRVRRGPIATSTTTDSYSVPRKTPATTATAMPMHSHRDISPRPPPKSPAVTTRGRDALSRSGSTSANGSLGLTGLGLERNGSSASANRDAAASSFLYADQQQQQQQHSRSLSVKSQVSEVTTDEGSSSGRDSLFPHSRKPRSNGSFRFPGADGGESIASLGRSGSSASTVPTSPDVEPMPKVPQSHLKGPVTSVQHDAADGFSAQKQTAAPGDFEDSQLASHFGNDDYRRPPVAWGKELPTITSVGDITHLSASSSASSNLNKPLPPLQPQPLDERSEEREILVTSPAPSKASSRTTLRSAFAQSGKYLRGSSTFWSHNQSNPKQGATLSTSSMDVSPNPSKSGSSLNPSPQRSRADMASDYAQGSVSMDVEKPPPRSHSPFLFRKRSKSHLLDANAQSSTADSASKPSSSTASSYFSLRRGSRQSHSSISPNSESVDRNSVSPMTAESSTADAAQSRGGRVTNDLTGSQSSETQYLQAQPPLQAGPFLSRPSSRVGPEKRAFHRPSLRRDRSRSVGEMDLLLHAESKAKEHTSTAAPSSSSHRHSASTITSPKSIQQSLSRSPPSNPFQLPPIATSPEGLFLVEDETRASDMPKPAKSQSFRWSRVLSKRGSQSTRKKSQDLPVSAGHVAVRDRQPSLNANVDAGLASVKSRESVDTRRTSVAPSLNKRVSDLPAVPGPDAPMPTSPSQRPTRQSIVQGSKSAQDQLSPNTLGLTSNTKHRRNSSLQSDGNPHSPLSPNLASLWTSATAFDSDDDVEAESKYHDATAEPASPGRKSQSLSDEHDNDTAAVAPPSRRGSLGKALSTMFDLKPSLEEHGALPQMPPMLQQAAAASVTADSQPVDVKTPPHSRSHSRSASAFNMLSRSSAKKDPASAALWQAASNSHSRAVSGASTTSLSNTMVTAKSSMSSIYQAPGELVKASYPTRSTSGPLDRTKRAISSRSGSVDASPSHVRRTSARAEFPSSPPSAGVKAAELAQQRARGAAAAQSSTSKPKGSASGVTSSTSVTSVRAKKLSNASRPTDSVLAGPRVRTKSAGSLKSMEAAVTASMRSIPPRGSSQTSKQKRAAAKAATADSTRGTLSASSSMSSVPSSATPNASLQGHRRTKSKPTLVVDTSHPRSGAPRQHIPRPSSSMGLYGLGSHDRDSSESGSMSSSVTGTSAFAKRLNQPQLQEMDDKAFLELLEETRRMHKEKAAKQQEESEMIARMAQMGMTPNRKSHQSRDRLSGIGAGHSDLLGAGASADGLAAPDALGDISGVSSSSAKSAASKSSTAKGASHRRASSADGRLGGMSLATLRRDLGAERSEDVDNEAVDLIHEDASCVGSGVSGTFNVGKASAQLSGAFANDDDWKREVRALFIIRELLNTEQSYARHLESLLQAVRRKAINAPSSGTSHPRRKSVTNFGGVSSSASSSNLVALNGKSSSSASATHGDRHLPLMRNLLPQLIALSRSLSARIDGNPTAAGVGTAFSVIAPQMEATFVAWSAAASEIMASLRHNQGPKGKSKDRLIMVPLSQDEPIGGGNDVDRSSASSALGLGAGMIPSTSQSQPPSPRKPRAEDPPTSLTRPSSPELMMAGGSSVATKRRSTISHGSGAAAVTQLLNGVTANGASKGGRTASGNVTTPSASTGAPKTTSATPSRPTSPWGFATATKRSLAAAASRPHTLTKKLTSSSSSFDLSAKHSADLAAAASKANGADGRSTPSPRKALSVLDVAIMPMQRPPRYLLLLTELVRNTPVDSVSHARVVRSLDLIKSIAGKCDAASQTL